MGSNLGLRRVLGFLVLGGILIAFLLLPGPSVLADSATPLVHPAVAQRATSGMLQFTSEGHILGFQRGGFYVSNANYALRVEFVGGNPVAPVSDKTGQSQLEQRGAPALSRVTYPGLWDGITLSYDGTRGGVVSSSYRVDAGADPRAIHLRYNAPVTINSDGTLTIAYATGEMRESAPVAWQEIAAKHVPVSVAFSRFGEREIGFQVGTFDAGQTLFIDPTLTWNTFLGGSGWDDATGIAVDRNGNAFVVGYSGASWGSPVNAFGGGDDGFVAKLSAGGVLAWNTFFGGSGYDSGNGIAVDNDGNIYVAGTSNGSWGSPVLPFMGDYDAFAAKLSPTGGLIWNTFLGKNGPDFGRAIAVDGSGNVYVAGNSDGSWGSPLRNYSGDYDAFLVKLNTSGTMIWNTFLGGTGYDNGNAIAVDGGGNVYMVGYSMVSWGGPVRTFGIGRDAFAAKLSPEGVLIWNTFLGGSGDDFGNAVALDADGNIYVGGSSSGAWAAPVRPFAGANEAFAAKLSPDGNLGWNTFLGGTGYDQGYAIAVDDLENVYVVGGSDGSWGSPVRAFSGRYDAFAAKLTPAGVLAWNSFVGGSSDDWGRAIAADAIGNVYVAGSSDTSWGSPMRSYTSGRDAFVATIFSFGSYLPLLSR